MKTKITSYIKAGYPGLYLVSHEEQRVEASLREALVTLNKSQGDDHFRLFAWSCSDGIFDVGKGVNIGNSEPMEMLEWFGKADQRVVLLVRDFHLFLEDKNPLVWRKFKDVLIQGKANNKTIIILGCRLALPAELEKEVAVIDFSLPDRNQLRTVLHSLLDSVGHKRESLNGDEAGILAAASGLTTLEAENAFALSIVEAGRVAREVVFREKCQAVRKNGLLEVVDSHVKLSDIGGLEALKKWLLERRDAFGDAAREYGLPSPRGMLTVGQPGTGKSLVSKACRSVFDVPLLRLDAGRLFGSLVGQSEQNWRTVHATAKAMSPCILWIDEVDGAMSGAGSSGQTDGGTTSRVIKSILQDMQENSEGIFYVLTANDVDNLPAPLLRRMDEVWNVELPSVTERIAIWNLKVAQFKRDPDKFDTATLAARTEGFSGAEIEKLVSQTLYVAFADGRREPTTQDVLHLLETFQPLSVTMAADIERRAKRLEGVARLASGTTKPLAKPVNRKLVTNGRN